MLEFGIPLWQLIVRTLAIYVAILVAFRVFGKREVGQFTLYDLVFVLLVANAVQPAITGPDTSLSGGIAIIVTLAVVNFLIGRLEPLRFFNRFLGSEPTLLIKDGVYLDTALQREGVDRNLCETAIREHGISDVSEVKLGVLEPDGTISIVPTDSPTSRTKRRVRYHRRS